MVNGERVARRTGWRATHPKDSRISSASSHPSGVENDFTPELGTLPAGLVLPLRGSIQNAMGVSPLSFSRLTENAAWLPR